MSSKARQLADLGNQVDDGSITGSNMVVNGGMTVAQRGVSATISSAVSYHATIDRFAAKYFGSSWSVSNHSRQEQVTDAPDGFLHSGKYTALIAQDYSNALGTWVQYTFENQDITSLQNGSGLKDFTVSLWLKSNKTGNVTLSVEGSGYSYSTYVTIDTASTWEYKTVTFPATNLAVGIDYTGDPTGGNFNFKVGLGSNGSWLVDTDNQWNDRTSNRGVLSPQQTNFQAAVNDYLQITGVCLNVGDSAIDFPHESYGDTLAKCQRYFAQFSVLNGGDRIFMGAVESSTKSRHDIPLATAMRATPTVSTNGSLSVRDPSSSRGFSNPILSAVTNSMIGLKVDISGATAGNSCMIRFNSASDYLRLDAEL